MLFGVDDVTIFVHSGMAAFFRILLDTHTHSGTLAHPMELIMRDEQGESSKDPIQPTPALKMAT